MLRNVTFGFVFVASVFIWNGIALADDSPTLEQVYQAAHAGRLDDAQKMMDIVLKEHPDSAKAHYVEAELLAKRDQMGKAEDELNTAERLNPDLSFANPQAVRDLKNRIAATHRLGTSPDSSYRVASGNSIPWGMILLAVGVIALIAFIRRAIRIRTAANMQNTSPVPGGVQPNGTGMAPTGSGIGSGIIGGLATGAAVGAGIVAGEVLAHRLMDGSHSDATNVPPSADSGEKSSNNMGGSNFGIADNSSWNDDSGVADVGSDVGGGDWG